MKARNRTHWSEVEVQRSKFAFFLLDFIFEQTHCITILFDWCKSCFKEFLRLLHSRLILRICRKIPRNSVFHGLYFQIHLCIRQSEYFCRISLISRAVLDYFIFHLVSILRLFLVIMDLGLTLISKVHLSCQSSLDLGLEHFRYVFWRICFLSRFA